VKVFCAGDWELTGQAWQVFFLGVIADAVSIPPQAQSQPTPRPSRPTQAQRRAVRKAYIEGRGTLPVLCQQFGLAYGTVKTWCTKEDWQSLRADFDKRTLEAGMPPPVAPAPPAQPQSPLQAQISRIESQLSEIEGRMRGCENPKSLADFSAAHARLFDAWCTLTGTPRPGVRKQPKGQARGLPIFTPTESATPPVVVPLPAPEVPPASGS